jgi:Caspase domain
MRALKSRSDLFSFVAAIMCGFVICAPAKAQSENPTRRIALIIGNSDYDRNGNVNASALPPVGRLRDIASACDDARAFAAALRQAHWTDAEMQGGARCDLTAAEMREQFMRIVQELSAPPPGERIMAVVYFAGHGAQFGEGPNQSQYLFGAGATFDIERIVNGITHSPGTTGYVANEAVDLTEILSRVGNQFENSLWIITDACRNNALYGAIQAESNMRIRAISPQNVDYGGVVVTYSTSGGDFSRDPPERGSVFADTLRQMLRPNARLADILNKLPRQVDAAYSALNEIGSQRPKSDGRFVQTWCVWSCPPQLEIFSAPRAEARFRLSPGTARMAALATRLPVRLASAANSTFPQAGTAGRPVSARTTQDRVVFDRFAAQESSAPQQRGMRVDLFWCDDLPGAPERQARATAIAERLRRLAIGQSVSGVTLGNLNFVRVRGLPSSANLLSDYRYTDDLVIVDSNSPAEEALAEAVAGLGQDRLSIRRDGRTPDYVSVVLCRTPLETGIVPRLFIQVPAADWLGLGRGLRGDLLQALPSLNIPAGIDVVAQSPANTEVRFYHATDRDRVFQAVSALETRLQTPVRIRYLPQYSGVAPLGQMELWVGTSQQAPRAPIPTPSLVPKPAPRGPTGR